MYAQNAFRLAELPTDSGRQDVLHRRQQLVTMRQVDPDLAPTEVLDAFDRILGDPRRRLVDEVFWLWDTSGADCGCTGTLHSDHDAAVQAHSAALDYEQNAGTASDVPTDELQRLWELASQSWGRVLRRAAFWDHLRHRIAALDDRQLDDSAIDVLRQTLPVVLVKPLVQLTVAASDGQAWRGDLAREWPAPKHVIDDQLEEAAGPLYDAVDQARTRAMQLIDDGHPRQAAALIDEQEPNLKQLKNLVPSDRHRRTATALNQAGVVYNNAALALSNMEGIVVATTCEAWYISAHVLATDPETAETIEANDSALDKEVEAIRTLEEQINSLVAMGHRRQARDVLLRIRRSLPPDENAPDLDRMLSRLGVSPPSPNRGAAPVTIPGNGYGRSRFSTGTKALVFTVVVAVLVLLLIWLLTTPSTNASRNASASVVEDQREDNAPAGTCIATKYDWREDKSAIPVVDCSVEHWGEILGYPELTGAPSSYPGDAQAAAWARFYCKRLLAHQGSLDGGYVTAIHPPDRTTWGDSGQRAKVYTACVVHRNDDDPMPAGQQFDSGWESDEGSVHMNLLVRSRSAPVGSCIEDRTDVREGGWDLVYVPVVTCDRLHWGEIVGYPVLYESGAARPGRQASTAKAQRVCRKLADERNLPSSTRITAGLAWGADEWSNPETKLHAVCVGHMKDNGRFEGRFEGKFA